jgi:predicted RNase H-like HicB family nuclease
MGATSCIASIQGRYNEGKQVIGEGGCAAGQPALRGIAVKDYHINIFYSDEDGGYIADIPDLASCSAFGETAEEALSQVQIAKAAWLEAAGAEGKPIPPPRYRPLIYQPLGG